MRHAVLINSLIGLTLASSIAYAAHKPVPTTPQYWSGTANLGFVDNTGNTDNENLSGKLDVQYNRTKWKNDVTLAGQLNTSRGTKTAERYSASYETNYLFSKYNFVFGRVSGLHDKFSPYDYSLTAAGGFGRRLLQTHRLSLDVKAGPGYNRLKETATDVVRDQLVAYIGGHFTWDITGSTTFTQDVNVNAGHPNTEAKSVTALNTKIVGNLGLQVSETLDYNSYIPPESTNTHTLDTTSNVALVYSF